MCIRDSACAGHPRPVALAGQGVFPVPEEGGVPIGVFLGACLLYTSDAADDLLCVDLGGRRFIKKKKQVIA